jgi:hypothetical protein
MVPARARAHGRPMALHDRPIHLGLAVLATAALLAACGDDSSAGSAEPAPAASETATADAAADSPYCRIALEWQVHELTPYDRSDPAVLEAYMGEYGDFVTDAAAAAPDEIHDEWALVDEAVNTTLIPLMARFGFDGARAQAEATPEELALMNEPPPAVQDAQEATHRYEALVCAAMQPPAADEHFTGPADSAYCVATRNWDAAWGGIIGDGADPAAIEALLTGGQLEQLRAEAGAAVPEAIAVDWHAVDDFTQEQKLPLLAEYGYDIRRVLLEGSPEERAVLNGTDPAISEPYARVLAYENQVCGEVDEG